MRRLLSAAAVLAALAACKGPDRTGQTTRGFYSPDFDTVWDVSERELVRHGFVPDRDASSKETKTLVSRHRLTMSPFAGRGYREQVTMTFREVPDQPNRWTVETNVLRETNMAMLEPSNPVVAKWEKPTRVPDAENLLTRSVEMFFVPRDVSPEFRSAYGMPPPARPPEQRPAAERPADPRNR